MCNKDACFNRQEYDVREERRRELEFLEKVWIHYLQFLSSFFSFEKTYHDKHLLFCLIQGGNPLDFKFGIATSHSVQSTSLTDHQAEHFLNRYIRIYCSLPLNIMD